MSDKKIEKKYYTTQADVIPAKDNPWAHELMTTIKKGKKVTGFASAHHTLVNTTSGEVAGDMAVIGVQKVVDKEEFVKFFGAGIVEVFGLTKPAKDLFQAIMQVYLEQKFSPDQLYINYDVIRDEYSYDKSRPTYTNGLNELCVKDFLRPVERRDNLYWVNPNLFYKGDRMRIVREYVLAGSEAHKQIEAQSAAAQQQQLEFDTPESD